METEKEIQPNIPALEPQTSASIPAQSQTNWSKILVFTILGLVIVAGSLYVGIQIGKSNTLSEIPTVTAPILTPTQTTAYPTNLPTISTTPTVDTTASWKTYTNTKYDFSFKIPTDWTNYSMSDFSPQPFTNTEDSLYLGPRNTDKKPPQVMQVSTHNISTYKEQDIYPAANCTVTSLTVGIEQIQAKHKICKGMESNGFITIKTSQFVFIIDELKDSEENHQLFTQILSTFKFTE